MLTSHHHTSWVASKDTRDDVSGGRLSVASERINLAKAAAAAGDAEVEGGMRDDEALSSTDACRRASTRPRYDVTATRPKHA